jgi:hypothetical protein
MRILLNYFLVYEEEVAEKHQKIYSFGKGKDSPADFGF